jgi:hypothetical protein
MLRAQTAQGRDPAEILSILHMPRVFVRKMRLFTSIYGLPWETDLFMWSSTGLESGLVVEIKSQQQGGSVDEKLPFVILSLEALQRPSAVILGGEGFRDGARVWAKRRASTMPWVQVFDDPEAFRRFLRGEKPRELRLKPVEPSAQQRFI